MMLGIAVDYTLMSTGDDLDGIECCAEDCCVCIYLPMYTYTYTTIPKLIPSHSELREFAKALGEEPPEGLPILGCALCPAFTLLQSTNQDGFLARLE
jgi:hypothetical protein